MAGAIGPPPPTEKTGQAISSPWWGNAGTFTITQIFGALEQLVINGVTINQPHTGIDIGMPVGTKLYSPIHAVVEGVGTDQYGNNFIKLKTDNGESVLLLHLSSMAVTAGQEIQVGTFLGQSGNSGLSTGPHLHFEVDDTSGKPTDPWQWLQVAGSMTGAVPGSANYVPPPSIPNPLQGVNDLANNINSYFTPQTAWKFVFIPLGIVLIGIGVFLYFFKEEAHAGEVAAGTVAGAAAKAP